MMEVEARINIKKLLIQSFITAAQHKFHWKNEWNWMYVSAASYFTLI